MVANVTSLLKGGRKIVNDRLAVTTVLRWVAPGWYCDRRFPEAKNPICQLQFGLEYMF